ncbi:methyl-accepting chemotaxis protein [Clostridium oryzae]|uniref:Methyl-accepting chemotaxis protein McpA n=1 Tax=Clostridium oryzae TaxID=1450648 RepID=A0A1V4IL49_9CLOT|nr:HAMP domain-containing methyl-accepting chemotaxis protein [Clostridium oryzae]OPJ60768.1 methyl-accepting chemotaxis protein McpA [Clostridium oryzae]
MKISLKTKIVLQILVAFFIPCIMFGIYTYVSTSNVMSPKLFKSLRVTIIIVMIAVLAAYLCIAYILVNKRIINPIKQLEKSMTEAGKGNFTVRANINTGDEIGMLGKYFDDMIESQDHIIKNIRNSSESLTAASEEISASSEEISSSTEEIAINIQEVAQSCEEQNSLIVQTSEVLVQLSSLVQIAQSKANTAAESSNSAMEAATNGRTHVAKTLEAIENINKTSSEAEKVMHILDELSNKISGIITTINAIAEQTNLLALNAAIEAARAGEHGKGFNVVAEEIRKLSEETGSGAGEISELINQMTALTKKAVESMDSNKQAVENGVEVASNTDKSFVNIISAAEKIVNDVKEIVEVTRDEVASSEQIVKLIDSVATITEKNSASSEEVAAATEQQSSVMQNIAANAEHTSDTAVKMNNLIEKYNV